MTTITIERALLEQVQEFLYRVTHWKGGNHEELTDLHDMKETIKAALVAPATAPATAPAWHVAPTVPGLWLNSVFMKVEDVEQWHIDCQLHLECARWFGPIPPDGDKP